MDSIPHFENEPHWLIFRGKLPGVLERGRMPSQRLDNIAIIRDMDEWVRMLNQRQIDGAGAFFDAGGRAGGVYEGNHLRCNCAAVREQG